MRLDIGLISVVFAAIAAVAGWLLHGRGALAGRRAVRQLQRADQDLRLETLSNPQAAGLAGQLRSAGLKLSAPEWRLGQLGLGALAGGLSWVLGLAGRPALCLCLFAAAAPTLWLRQHRAGRI